MARNFLNIAFRYLWRNKTYSLLNYCCLTFGLICAIIALIYSFNIIGYDKFQENYDRIYSVNAYVTYFNGDRLKKESMSASLSDMLREHAPEIEETTRAVQVESPFIYEDKVISEKGYYADASFFKMFTFPFIHPDQSPSLKDQNSIVISESMALKFFGKTDCVDKILVLKENQKQEPFKVAGVFKNVPSASTLQFDFVLPISKFLADNPWAFDAGSSICSNWILLKQNTDYKLVESKIKDLIKGQESTLNQELFLYPLKDMALYSYVAGKKVWKGMQDVFIAATIGFAILLIACFNFINLAIALNMRRYCEVGIKKVAGAKRSSIIIQFLGETFLITFMSLISAIFFIELLLPGFNALFNTRLMLNLLDFKIIAIISSLLLLTILISGLLPALFLSSMKPTSVLKGKMVAGNSYGFIRQGSIVIQFTIPIVLIIILMVINRQDIYLRNYDIGLDKDKLIIVENFSTVQAQAEGIRSELNSIPEIDAVSFTNCLPTRGARVTNELSWEGKEDVEKLHFWCIDADFDYTKIVKINMAEGRFFNPAFSTDSANYVVNDIALEAMKKKVALGSMISLEGKKGTIIGIFKDFHAIDLAGPMVPVIIRINPLNKRYLIVHYSTGSLASVAPKIEAVFKHYEPTSQIHMTHFRDLYPINDLSFPSKLAGLSFIIALLLACAGLFGLASFTTERRTKEIGIRKVNGASTLYVMRLLLFSYLKCITIAFMIALPIAFFLGQSFLSRFHFHTPIPLLAFISGPIIADIIALLTVSAHSWHAASGNPVKALRYE
ncbi:MAG: ABC transporter permease [Candidatus Saccharibacteria bacterium]